MTAERPECGCPCAVAIIAHGQMGDHTAAVSTRQRSGVAVMWTAMGASALG